VQQGAVAVVDWRERAAEDSRAFGIRHGTPLVPDCPIGVCRRSVAAAAVVHGDTTSGTAGVRDVREPSRNVRNRLRNGSETSPGRLRPLEPSIGDHLSPDGSHQVVRPRPGTGRQRPVEGVPVEPVGVLASVGIGPQSS
jgi:hypothetical protein